MHAKETVVSDRPIRIMLLEDDPADARLLQEYLHDAHKHKFELAHVERLQDALDLLKTETYDVILLDLTLPDSSGLDTVRRVHSQAPTIPIVVLTGLNDESVGLSAVREGAQDYLVKGQTQAGLLIHAIHYALEREKLRKEKEQLIKELKEALANVKHLSGLLPICAHCKKIRDDNGYWKQIELYIDEHSEATFSHGVCPECAAHFYPKSTFEHNKGIDV